MCSGCMWGFGLPSGCGDGAQGWNTCAHISSVKDGGTKQIVLSLSKQYTDLQGWEAAELDSTAQQGWLQHRAGVV